MKRSQRFLSFLLALVMILPMFSVMVVAQEEPTFLWTGESFDAGSFSNVAGKPASAQIVSKDALGGSDKALKIDIKGVASASRTAPYYAWGSNNAIYEITDYSYDAASNTVSGQFSDGTATYTIGGTLDTGVKATCEGGTYYVYTPDMVDARTGYNNVANAAVVRNPLINTTKADTAVFQYKIWFENGSKGILASRAYTSGGKYVEFFGMTATGDSVTLHQHENALIAAGSAVTFKTGEWHTVSVALDFNDRWYDLYLDGVYAFSAINRSGSSFELPMPFDIGANKWNLIQINRNNTSAADLAGSLMIDDVCIYDGSILDTFTKAPAIEKTDDFESYTADKITKAEGYNLSDGGNIVAYNKLLSENLSGSTNKFVRVPLLYDGTGSNVIGTAGYTNYDKTLTLAHPQLTKENGEYAVFEIDYRYNAEANCTNGTIETQLYNFNFDMELSKGAAIAGTAVANTTHNKAGVYLSLFTINLKDGSLAGHDTNMTKTGAASLKENEWNTVRYVLNLKDTSYYLYVNGVLYGYDDALPSVISSDWKTCTNVSNIKIPANNLIISKVNKKDASFNKVAEANSNYSNVNYIDIDNVSLTSSNETPVFVLPPVSALESFENGTAGSALSSSNSSTNTAYSKVLPETVEGNANQFLRVPLLYDGTGDHTISTNGYTNYDKTVTLKHSTISTQTGKYAVFTVDYRPHAEANANTGTIEIQINGYKFDALSENGSQKSTAPRVGTYEALAADEKGVTGIFLKLFDINLATGELTGNSSDSLKKTGAKGLNPDEWNTVQFVMNLEDSSSSLYVNGALYGVSERMSATSSSWYYYTNPSNIVFTPNCLFAAKVNKKDAAFNKAAEADETYSNVNYIDIDNVSLKSATEEDVTVLPEVNEDGLALMYIEIGGRKVENKNLYLTKDIAYTVKYFDPSTVDYSGILSTETKSSIRLSAPTGLRFATKVLDTDALDALFRMAGDAYSDVEIGTLIVPTSYVSDIDFTVEALRAAGRSYLTVEAAYGRYYPVYDDPATTHFVGSIVNILPQNATRSFSATGYIKVTLWGGREFYFYSDTAHAASVNVVAQAALEDQSRVWSDFDRAILEQYAAGKTIDELIKEDMKGLNVLAFGDSLFGGTIGYDQATQWVNKLGVDNEWNLTNLGIGSMTVSFTERNNVSEYGNKNSMYDWMFNGKNDFRWNSSSTHTSPNPFFKTGNCTDNKGDVELIILEGGCNDYGTAISAPLGTVDSKDPATFLGAWNCITERLLEEYPNATIVFLTSWRLNPQTRTDDTLTSIEFSESVITLYEEVYVSNDRIALINAGDPKVSGVDMLDTEWRTTYSTDSYHLKDTGMAVMADHMLPLLWEIVMKSREAN